MDAARQLLLDARRFIESGWTQHADARGEDGAVVNSWSAQAVRWSLLGALVASFERISQAGDGSIEHLARACTGLADAIEADSLEAWNDAPERQQEDVLSAVDAALRALPNGAFVISPN